MYCLSCLSLKHSTGIPVRHIFLRVRSSLELKFSCDVWARLVEDTATSNFRSIRHAHVSADGTTDDACTIKEDVPLLACSCWKWKCRCSSKREGRGRSTLHRTVGCRFYRSIIHRNHERETEATEVWRWFMQWLMEVWRAWWCYQRLKAGRQYRCGDRKKFMKD
jgi:hypothetical protein